MKVPYADFSCPIVLLSMRSWPLSFVCHIGANGSPIHGIGQQSCPLKQHNRRVVFSKSHAMSGRYSPIPKHESVSGTLYLNRFKFLGPCGPASRANDKKICIWDTSSWALLTTLKDKCIHTVTFSLDSTVLVLGGMGRWIELWDTEFGPLLGTWNLIPPGAIPSNSHRTDRGLYLGRLTRPCGSGERRPRHPT